MTNLLNQSFVTCDAPRPLGIYLQHSPSPQMEALIELHDNIMFYLVIILFGVAWILISVVRNYINNKYPISNKYINPGTLIELIFTITPALILILIALPSFKLLYLMDEITDPSLTLFVEGHEWYLSYQYNDFLSHDDEELILDSVVNVHNIWTDLFGNHHGNMHFVTENKPNIFTKDVTVFEQLSPNIDFYNHVSHLDRNGTLNFFAQSHRYIVPSVDLIEEYLILRNETNGPFIPADFELDYYVEHGYSYQEMLQFADDGRSLDDFNSKRLRAIRHFDNTCLNKMSYSYNGNLGLGVNNFHSKFESFYRFEQFRSRFILQSLNVDSWKGLPKDFSNDLGLVFTTLSEDYSSYATQQKFFNSVSDTRMDISPINRLGHTNLLTGKYSILDFCVNSPLGGEAGRDYKGWLKLSRYTVDSLSVFEDLMDKKDLIHIDRMTTSTAPNLKGYIIAIREQFDRLST